MGKGKQGVGGVKGLAVRKVSRVKTEVMSLGCLPIPLLLVVSQDSKRQLAVAPLTAKETCQPEDASHLSSKATYRRGRKGIQEPESFLCLQRITGTWRGVEYLLSIRIAAQFVSEEMFVPDLMQQNQDRKGIVSG